MRQLRGSKACAQARWQRQRALPKELAARVSMQAEHPAPGTHVSAPALVQPSLPPACKLTAAPGRTGAVLPAGTLISIPHCDSSPLMSQALGAHHRPSCPTAPAFAPSPVQRLTAALVLWLQLGTSQLCSDKLAWCCVL